jgi:hypothetical protein
MKSGGGGSVGQQECTLCLQLQLVLLFSILCVARFLRYSTTRETRIKNSQRRESKLQQAHNKKIKCSARCYKLNPGPNPTIMGYKVSDVKIYNAESSLLRFENKNAESSLVRFENKNAANSLVRFEHKTFYLFFYGDQRHRSP